MPQVWNDFEVKNKSWEKREGQWSDLGPFENQATRLQACTQYIPGTFYQRKHQLRYQELFHLLESCQLGLQQIF